MPRLPDSSTPPLPGRGRALCSSSRRGWTAESRSSCSQLLQCLSQQWRRTWPQPSSPPAPPQPRRQTPQPQHSVALGRPGLGHLQRCPGETGEEAGWAAGPRLPSLRPAALAVQPRRWPASLTGRGRPCWPSAPGEWPARLHQCQVLRRVWPSRCPCAEHVPRCCTAPSGVTRHKAQAGCMACSQSGTCQPVHANALQVCAAPGC